MEEGREGMSDEAKGRSKKGRMGGGEEGVGEGEKGASYCHNKGGKSTLQYWSWAEH